MNEALFCVAVLGLTAFQFYFLFLLELRAQGELSPGWFRGLVCFAVLGAAICIGVTVLCGPHYADWESYGTFLSLD